MSRRLLAISWDMPPLSGPRAVQVSRLLKHLVPLGWESWVVSFGPRSGRYNQDRELASRLRAPEGVTLVPVPSLEERLLCRMLWRVLPPLKLLPDEKWVWIGAASRAAGRLAAERRFDVLVSFAQPWSDHLIGLRVRRATGLPWVAHFSDPWTDSPYLRGHRWQRRIWERMEADVVRHADALVFVNEQTAERVMRKYPDEWRRKSHVLPHGYDCSDRSSAAPAVPGDLVAQAFRPDKGGRLSIVYTGRFYDGIRTPEPLLRAVAALGRRRRLAHELHVTFVGTPVVSHRQLASALGLDDVVEFTGRVPFADSSRRANDADVLLIIDAPADESLFLPSKLVDYLPAGKPILALTPPRGASADLVRALGYPVILPDDEPGIAAAIEALIVAKQAGRLTMSATHMEVAQRYDIRRTAGAFAEILARCT
jgi:glycosyltransferase involved in cell wall biosynthesis